MIVQNIILPLIYKFYKKKYIEEKLVIFADAHHNTLPFSMSYIYKALYSSNYKIIICCDNYSSLSAFSQLQKAVYFMKLYAQAKYVFICDNFIPVASCQKRAETIVVQLWHAGGILKKFSYDAGDIPKYYYGNVYKNCDMVTVSAELCKNAFSSAMRLPLRCIAATGISRTDFYFQESYLEACRHEFYQKHPEANGKKIILWAPTYRGSSTEAFFSDSLKAAFEAVKNLVNEESWAVFWVGHPHQNKTVCMKNSDIPTERLLPVTDVLITDYSSILFDYLLFEKPIVLLVPDLKEYQDSRGFSLDYNTLPGLIVEDTKDLHDAVKESLQMNGTCHRLLCESRQRYMEQCDGRATERILEKIQMRIK